MKKLTARVHHRILGREVEAKVIWMHDVFNHTNHIMEINFKGEDIQRFIPVYQIVNIQNTIDKISIELKHKDRINMSPFFNKTILGTAEGE